MNTAPNTAPPATIMQVDIVDIESPLPSPGTGKKVMLRRTLNSMHSSSASLDVREATRSPADRKQVLLAHKIRPGQTIQLKSSNATARMSDQGDPELFSESLVNSPKRSHGPAYDERGELQSFSLLGPGEPR